MTATQSGHTFTTPQAAALLKVPAARIRRWRSDGEAKPSGLIRGRGGAQPLWRLEELQPLADRYHARHANNSTTDNS